jgi:hypothetical protein
MSKRRTPDLAGLEAERAQLYRQLGEVGDFRRGSLNEVRRKCGRANCACAAPGHPGHGPQYNFTRSVEGKTVNVHLKPGPLLDKTEREVANYKQFLSQVEQIVEVNEEICEARPISALAEGQPSEGEAGAEKGGSSRRSKRSSPKR